MHSFEYKLFIDLETTNLSARPYIDEKTNRLKPAAGICEIYAELYKGDTLIDVFHEYAVPTNEQIADAYNKQLIIEIIANKITTTQTELYSKFMAFLHKYSNPYNKYEKINFIAYNSAFDESFIREVIKTAGLNWGNFFITNSICLYRLSTFALGDLCNNLKDNTLSTICSVFGIKVKQDKLHTAKYDIHIMKQLWNMICIKLNKQQEIINIQDDKQRISNHGTDG